MVHYFSALTTQVNQQQANLATLNTKMEQQIIEVQQEIPVEVQQQIHPTQQQLGKLEDQHVHSMQQQLQKLGERLNKMERKDQ